MIYYEFLEVASCILMNIIEMFINLPFTLNFFDCVTLHMCMRCHGERDIKCPRIAVLGGYESHIRVLGVNSGPLEKHTAILTYEPKL